MELPALPSDANALSFGDWLATIQPLIADVSVSAEEWWAVTLKGVDELYTQWLASDPLQRLRLDTGTSSAATRWPRTERRMTSLLLQAVPDNIKAEAVAARKLSVTHLLFTLFVKFQPGGQGERVTLIRLLTELKTTGSMVELAQNLRQWRRWWNRAQELAVMLPDPVILAGVLTRASDAIAKSGAQAAYRLSVCRQLGLHQNLRGAAAGRDRRAGVRRWRNWGSGKNDRSVCEGSSFGGFINDGDFGDGECAGVQGRWGGVQGRLSLLVVGQGVSTR